MKGTGRYWPAAVAVLLGLGAGAYFALPYFLRTADDQPPLNTVVISEQLASSGQPSAAQLRQLRATGYESVINLAPASSYGSIGDEPDIVVSQGMRYIAIPVVWEKPALKDFEKFREALRAQSGHRVWVHCQMNMRASVFVFLHRVIEEHVSVPAAIEAVHAVWVPNQVWQDFMREVLTAHRISFDPVLLR